MCIRLVDVDGAAMEMVGQRAEYLYGTVDGIGEVAAALEEDDLAEYRRSTPDFCGRMTVTAGSTVGALTT